MTIVLKSRVPFFAEPTSLTIKPIQDLFDAIVASRRPTDAIDNFRKQLLPVGVTPPARLNINKFIAEIEKGEITRPELETEEKVFGFKPDQVIDQEELASINGYMIWMPEDEADRATLTDSIKEVLAADKGGIIVDANVNYPAMSAPSDLPAITQRFLDAIEQEEIASARARAKARVAAMFRQAADELEGAK